MAYGSIGRSDTDLDHQSAFCYNPQVLLAEEGNPVGMYLNIALIIISVALISVIILQSRGAGLGGLTGGDPGGGAYHKRRGIERLLFQVTIGLSVLFFTLAILSILIRA